MASGRLLQRRDLLASPANFFAFGCGTGLSPKAPGTVGTLLGIPIALALPDHLVVQLAVIVALFVVGIYLCDVATRYLQVHDHGGIVWDEVVGYLVTMIAMPRSFLWLAVGFLVFRFFDILKPWPISWVDARIHGGFGIMLDDVLAALMALAVMQGLFYLMAAFT